MPRDHTLWQAGKSDTPEGGREYQIRIVNREGPFDGNIDRPVWPTERPTSGPSLIRSTQDFDKAMAELEKSYWATRISGGLVVDGKHRRRVWKVVRRPT